jgi:hypothetical protein
MSTVSLTELQQNTAAAGHEEMLAGLDPGEQGGRVLLQLRETDGAHGSIVPPAARPNQTPVAFRFFAVPRPSGGRGC